MKKLTLLFCGLLMSSLLLSACGKSTPTEISVSQEETATSETPIETPVQTDIETEASETEESETVVSTDIVVEEQPTENTTNSWDSFNLVIDGVNVNFYDFTTCSELANHIVENNSMWTWSGVTSMEHETNIHSYILLSPFSAEDDTIYKLEYCPDSLTLELPCGITQDSTPYEIIETYGQPTYIYESESYWYYYYYTTDYSKKMEIQISAPNGAYNGSLYSVAITDMTSEYARYKQAREEINYAYITLEEYLAKEKESMDKLLMNEGSNYLSKEP